MNELCNHTSNESRFDSSLLFSPLHFKGKCFLNLSCEMYFSFHQINWHLWYLKNINDTHEKAKHVLQHTKLFNKKLNLIFMDHGGRVDKSSNLKFLKIQIFAQHKVKTIIKNKISMISFWIFFPFWAIQKKRLY